ncbi:MAG TPA: tetratricopeptide repeat protein [Vicinamibacteria bacterium]|nr:tetratricopeptide repeat protein [Vicinamibacteria bacterium]
MPEKPATPTLSERSTLDRTVSRSAGSFDRYRLLQRVGEGGMGEVWLAEQTEPVRRQVALKVIKVGMDSAQVVARFEAERQALALMDHPGIATVFDGGTTPEGRPFFAMELVRGEPITTYCDRHRLTTRQRLELFMLVCEGVQHAHQKGIIHRDLKPSNLLVTIQDERPVPKIIDFGVAKATAQHLTERTLFTELGALIGTPEYMSPEQAEMGALDIDTRTDIYALGVLLYELLTGSLPFSRRELGQAGFSEIQRIIREKEPPRPSTRITELGAASTEAASNRHTEPLRLASELRGDLDWITMRALEKDRTRRYQTAGALSAEILRYLSNEPVSAGPPSPAYRAKKFLRRHRVGVAAGATVAAALIVGLGAALIGLRAAVRARDAEATARKQAESALEFVSDMFGAVDPRLARGHDVTVAEIVDPAAAKVARSFAGDAEGEAVVRGVIGQAYSNLARYPDALREFDRAFELRQALGQASTPPALSLRHNWGATLLASGDVARARDLLRQVWQERSVRLGPTHRDALATRSLLAYARQLAGDLDGATAEIREVLRDQERSLGPGDRDTLESQCSLADMLNSAGQPEEALRVAHEAATRAASAHGADGDLALMAASIEAESLDDLSRHEEAATLLARVVRGKERLYGPNHPETLVSMDLLASSLKSLGQDERAITLNRAVVDRATRTLGEGHASTLTYMNNLAQALRQGGRLAEAEPIFRRVIELRSQHDGPRATETMIATSNLGLLLLQRNAPVAALPLLREAVDGLRSSLPPDHWMIGVALLNLGRCQTALHEHSVAEVTLLDAHARLQKSLGATHGRTNQARMALTGLYTAWGKPEKAKTWRESLEAPGQ